ncbi:caspase family protein [Nocardia sp. 348MFTsu5.1]|uniref:caspase family protein n=1 Tax=Nocardia sp. 348MFTsu5.1 TaxID=1172185 RepID=UPI0012DD6C95|nr:caspase family protein [Nocardia sp. 348MFTsu5.1]
MHRGAVFIGVDRTGAGMPVLRAAASGAQQMHDWAVDPDRGGMDPATVRLLTDTDGKVTSDGVLTAVEELVATGVDQLILYFAGHGLLVDMIETWMLSDAPTRGNAAISVGKSIQAAKRGKTPHVVIISDACRTPAQDLDTQSLTPVSAFPNSLCTGSRPRVDVFYASAQGEAAIEINTVAAEGIYTSVLHEALNGRLYDAQGLEGDVMVRAGDDDPRWYIYTNPLCVYLETAVSARLAELDLDLDQSPTFDVQVGANTRWLACVDRGDDGPLVRGITGTNLESTVPRRSLSKITADLYQAAVGQSETFDNELGRAESEGAGRYVSAVRSLLDPPATDAALPPSAGMRRGVSVRGTSIRRATSPGGSVVTDGHVVDFAGSGTHMVVLELDNGTATMLPVVEGHVTEIHVVGRHISAVFFEPESTNPVREQYIRRIKAIVTASAQRRRHQDVLEGVRLAALLARGRPDDLTLALYQAYALHSRQDLDRLADLRIRLTEQRSGIEFLDLILMDTESPGSVVGDHFVTPFPLLTQGWDLLTDDGPMLWSRTGQLRGHLLPSLWTVFGSDATDLLFQPA